MNSNLPSPLWYEAIGLILGAIVAYMLLKWKQNKLYEPLRSLPSPPQHWLWGNAPEILAAVKAKQLFKLFYDRAVELGPMYVLWAGGRPLIILSRAKVIEETIVNGMRDGSLVRSKRGQQTWNDITGPIMLGQSGSEWQWRRKAWNPEFSVKVMPSHLDTVKEAANAIVEQIKQTPAPQEIKADRLFVELTMRVMCALFLGVPIDKNKSSTVGPALDVEKIYQAMSVITYRILRVAAGEKMWLKYLPTKNSRAYWQARQDLAEFLYPRLDLALEMRDNPNGNWHDVDRAFKESMLVKIAAKEPKYDRACLFAEAVELLIAGTDTTAHTLSFAMAELRSNERVYCQAKEIVDRVWENYGGITGESLKELNYIRAIFRETLRLYSVANGSSSLEATEHIIIENKVVPKGTRISWSILAAGRDPEVYSDREEFKPERWLETSSANKPLLIQFGSGLHRCLGEHLATLEATVMLTMLLRYFDWDLVNGGICLEKLQQNLLVYPPDRMPAKFKLRKTEAEPIMS